MSDTLQLVVTFLGLDAIGIAKTSDIPHPARGVMFIAREPPDIPSRFGRADINSTETTHLDVRPSEPRENCKMTLAINIRLLAESTAVIYFWASGALSRIKNLLDVHRLTK